MTGASFTDAAGDSRSAETPRPTERATDAEVEAAVERIHDRAAEIRDREVETALGKLDATGDLSTADREAVSALADRLVARLIATPERGLRSAAEEEPTGETDGATTADENGAAAGDGDADGAGTTDADGTAAGDADADGAGTTDADTIETALDLFG
ncbi:hypothetical protein [Halosimplex salinum]|uniref:hypothetical protein n=1 Tax=Halosimplex salinum TaxID=1710538 RepID=UPI000F45F618|nr:hypothetical protein [Halosimplex salinum]